MDPATTAALAGLISMLSTEAIKTFGAMAFLVIVPALIFAVIIIVLKRQLAAKDKVIEAKDAEIKSLRDEKEKQLLLRLENAEATMRLAKSGTETMAARSEGDQAFRDLLTKLVDQFQDLREDLRARDTPARSRRPSR